MDINLLNPDFFQLAIIVKPTALVLIGIYIIFTFVIFNQVRVMNKIISTPPVSNILELIAFIHILAAISLFIYSLVIL